MNYVTCLFAGIRRYSPSDEARFIKKMEEGQNAEGVFTSWTSYSTIEERRNVVARHLRETADATLRGENDRLLTPQGEEQPSEELVSYVANQLQRSKDGPDIVGEWGAGPDDPNLLVNRARRIIQKIREDTA